MALLRHPFVPLACLASTVGLAAACAGGSSTMQSSAATGSGGTGTATHASSSASTGGMAGTGGTAGTGGSSGSATLALPQFVHGAAYADTEFFPTIPVVVSATGTTPDSVDVTIDNGTPVTATTGKNGYVATVAIAPLDPGAHMLVAQAKKGGSVIGTVKGSLTIGAGSLQLTHFAQDGLAYDDQLHYDGANDVLAYTWVDAPQNVASPQHQIFFNDLDGAFNRLLSKDVVLNDPSDEPLSGYTAFGQSGIGVVYRTGQAIGNPAPPWHVKMRVVDPTGQKVLVPTVDLTQGDAAYEFQAAGADPGGFSAAWLNIPSATDGSTPLNELRFARWDLASNKLVGPIVLDTDQPAPSGSTQGTQVLEPTSEMSIACNADVCLVAYVRDVYQALIPINTPKVFVAVVDLKSGTLASTPKPLAAGGGNFDPQMWGVHVVTLADGSFVLVYQDSVLLPPPCPAGTPSTDTCCDPNAGVGEEFFTVKFDATGTIQGAPAAIFAHEGYREYPRIAPLPEGFALFWEDQRSECPETGGHIRMAANTVGPQLAKLLDPYVEVPGSIALPPEYPTLAPTGTSFVVAWADARHGDNITMPVTELFLDTYWHE